MFENLFKYSCRLLKKNTNMTLDSMTEITITTNSVLDCILSDGFDVYYNNEMYVLDSYKSNKYYVLTTDFINFYKGKSSIDLTSSVRCEMRYSKLHFSKNNHYVEIIGLYTDDKVGYNDKIIHPLESIIMNCSASCTVLNRSTREMYKLIRTTKRFTENRIILVKCSY